MDKGLAIALLVGLALRLAFFFTAQPWSLPEEHVLSGDQRAYLLEALSLLEDGRFALDGEPMTYHTPGYALFVAGVISVAGQNPAAVHAAQMLVGLGTCCLAFFAVRRLFGLWPGRVAALLFAMDPVMIFMCYFLRTEVLSLFFLCVGLYAAVLAATQERRRRALALAGLAGLLLGLGMHVRPLIQFYPLFVCAAFVLAARGGPARRLGMAVVLYCVFQASLVPWSLRNEAVSGEYTFSAGSESWLPIVSFTIIGLDQGLEPTEASRRYDVFVREHLGLAPGAEPTSGQRAEAAGPFLVSHLDRFLYWSARGTAKNMLTLGTQSMYHYLMRFEAYDTAHFRQDERLNEEGQIGYTLRSGPLGQAWRYLTERPPLMSVLFALQGSLLLLCYAACAMGLGWLALVRRMPLTALLVTGVVLHIPFIVALAPEPRMRMMVAPVYLALAAQGIYLATKRGRPLRNGP